MDVFLFFLIFSSMASITLVAPLLRVTRTWTAGIVIRKVVVIAAAAVPACVVVSCVFDTGDVVLRASLIDDIIVSVGVSTFYIFVLVFVLQYLFFDGGSLLALAVSVVTFVVVVAAAAATAVAGRKRRRECAVLEKDGEVQVD